MNLYVKTTLPVFVAALVVVACSTDPQSDIGRRGDDPASNGTSDGGSAIAPSGGSVRAPYQVKTTAELSAAVVACFGQGTTTVTESMIQTQANPAGFLSARQFGIGANVVEGESSIIDGDPSVERVGVRNSTLSLPILAALQDIGNVVGENCKNLTENDLCDCSTAEKAHAMLGRCLPAIAPSKYTALESTFAASCATDRAAAIASLLGSTAFGVQ